MFVNLVIVVFWVLINTVNVVLVYRLVNFNIFIKRVNSLVIINVFKDFVRTNSVMVFRVVINIIGIVLKENFLGIGVNRVNLFKEIILKMFVILINILETIGIKTKVVIFILLKKVPVRLKNVLVPVDGAIKVFFAVNVFRQNIVLIIIGSVFLDGKVDLFLYHKN